MGAVPGVADDPGEGTEIGSYADDEIDPEEEKSSESETCPDGNEGRICPEPDNKAEET